MNLIRLTPLANCHHKFNLPCYTYKAQLIKTFNIKQYKLKFTLKRKINTYICNVSGSSNKQLFMSPKR